MRKRWNTRKIQKISKFIARDESTDYRLIFQMWVNSYQAHLIKDLGKSDVNSIMELASWIIVAAIFLEKRHARRPSGRLIVR